MTSREFRASAGFIAKRNVSERVRRIVATFDQTAGHLTVIYAFNEEPSDDDREDCELTCAELSAEFPEIRTSETHCVTAAIHRVNRHDHDDTVYQRE